MIEYLITEDATSLKMSAPGTFVPEVECNVYSCYRIVYTPWGITRRSNSQGWEIKMKLTQQKMLLTLKG